MTSEFPKDKLLEAREPEALPRELIANYTLLQKQLEQFFFC
jgi:hypothetical protein